MPRFKKRYFDVVRPELMKKFGYKNALQAPRIEKIVLNIGAGEGAADTKKIQSAQNDLTAIAGPEGRDHAGEEGDLGVQDHARVVPSA